MMGYIKRTVPLISAGIQIGEITMYPDRTISGEVYPFERMEDSLWDFSGGFPVFEIRETKELLGGEN